MRQHSLTYITAVLTLLSSCANDEFLQDVVSGGTPMSLSFNMSGEESGLMSRAAVSSFGDADYLGVCLRSGASTATYDNIAYENVKYTGNGTYSSGTQPMLSANTGYVYAYYPYADGTNITAISMSDSQTDYMYGSATSTGSDAYTSITCSDHSPSVQVYMHHAKALLKVNVIRGTYTGAAKVTAIKACGDYLTSTGTLNATDGTVTPGDKADISVSLSKTLPNSGEAWDEASQSFINDNLITENMLVVSKTTSTQSVTFTVTVDGKDYTATISDLTIQSQYKTTINLTLNDTGLTVSGFSISAWGTTTDQSGTIAPKAAEPEYVVIGGLKWATMNVGATTVADSPETSFGDYYAWGSTESLISIFNWSQLTDWGTVVRPTFKSGKEDGYIAANNPSSSYTPSTSNDGSSCFDNSHDLGKILYGSKWRVPSSNDFESLCKACGVTGYGTTTKTDAGSTITTGGIYWINPNKGSSQTIDGVTYKVPGILFVATSDINKRVFFPSAGQAYYKYIGSITGDANNPTGSAGIFGVYWSSSMTSYSYESISFDMIGLLSFNPNGETALIDYYQNTYYVVRDVEYHTSGYNDFGRSIRLVSDN